MLGTFLAISGACAIGIALPVFDVVSLSPTFLVAHGIVGGSQIAFAVALIVIPTLLVTAVVLSITAASRSAGRVVEALVVGGLLALATSSPIATMLPSMPGLATLLVVVTAAALAAVYGRFELAKRYVRILSLALPALALWFCVFGPSKVVGSPRAVEVERSKGHDASLVHVVLDEFSLGSIMRPDGTIDEDRFPNFARLARSSTWFSDATTNANATRIAVPTTLVGRFPTQRHSVPPTERAYPDNLFSLLDASHDLHVSETITGLCSSRRCPDAALPFSAVKHFAADTTLVYLHRVAPPLVKRRLPSLPARRWAGFFADPLLIPQRLARIPGPVRGIAARVLTSLADPDVAPYSIESRRFDAFIRSIRRPPRRAEAAPGVWFLHSLLPHHPWHLTDDGRPYDDQAVRGDSSGRFATRRDGDEALQRYMLQVKATDRLVGKLIDRLKAEGLWDDTMLVVHADHGVTFDPGVKFRSMSGSPHDVLAIPLFVRFPGQREGVVDRGNAELVDILPTIADGLGVEIPWRVDGASLRSADRRPTKRTWDGSEPVRALPPIPAKGRVDPRRTAAKIERLFGPARSTDDLYAWGPFRDMVGRRAPKDGLCRLPATLFGAGRYATFDPDGPFIPIRISGTVASATRSTWYAVAVNGRVAGLGQPYALGRSTGFSIVAAPRWFRTGNNEIDVFSISDACDRPPP